MFKALRSVSVIWIGMLLAAGISFLSQVMLARSLDRPEYGLFSAISNLVLILAPLATLGIGHYWLKMYGLKGWSAMYWVKPSSKLLLMSIPLSLFLVILIGSFAWQASEERILVYLLSSIILMRVFSDTASSRFQLEEKYLKLAIWGLIPPFGRLFVVGTVFALGLGVYELAIGLCVVSLSVSFIGYIYTRALTNGKIKLVGHGVDTGKSIKTTENNGELTKKKIFVEIYPFALASFFGLVYLQSDIVLLSLLADNDQAGLYNAAFVIMSAIYLLPTAVFNQYLLPKYHRWSSQDMSKFLNVYRFGNASMLILGSMIMLFVMIVSPIIVPLFFGNGFIDAVDILFWLAICIPLRFLSANVGSCLVTKDNMRRRVVYQGVVAVFNVVLNFVLIPVYGVFGAIISTVLSEAFLLALYFYSLNRYVFVGNAFNGWHLDWKSISA